MFLSKLKFLNFLQDQDDSNIDLNTIQAQPNGFYQMSDIKLIEKACHKKLDFVKTTLDDMKPQLISIKSNKNLQESLKLKIHECSNELELTKSQINKIGEAKLQTESENKNRQEMLQVLLEKFCIVRQQLLETINAYQEEQHSQVTQQRKTIQRLSIVAENETNQIQKQNYKQIIYDEEYILQERQKEIQEILYQLQNVVGMIEYVDSKVEEQGLTIQELVTKTEDTNKNMEKAKQELITFQRIKKNECSDVAFCFMMGTIVVIVTLVVTA